MYLYTNNVSSAGQQLEALELASRVNTFSPPLKKKPIIKNHIWYGERGTEGLKYTAKGLPFSCCCF